MCDESETFAEWSARAGYELPCGLFSRVGLNLTTTHVMAAASAITHTMKTTRPISPRTVIMPDLE
jgi:hypothetical protein